MWCKSMEKFDFREATLLLIALKAKNQVLFSKGNGENGEKNVKTVILVFEESCVQPFVLKNNIFH